MQKTALALLILSLTSCASLDYAAELADAPSTASAPVDKALVIFHRPTDRAGYLNHVVFDSYTLIGETLGEQRFHFVCDPGEHVFVGFCSAGGRPVGVVSADLAPGRVYDMVLSGAGFGSEWVKMVPLAHDDDRRERLPDWESTETLVALRSNGESREFEANSKDKIAEILSDFTKGEKVHRLLSMAPGDHR